MINDEKPVFSRKYLKRLAESVVTTFVAGFLGQFIAVWPFGVDDITDLDVIKRAALAGLLAVLVFAKGLAGRFIGDPDSTSVLP